MKQAYASAIGAAFFRAVGMLYPKEKQLFNDPYAEKVITPLYKFFINLMRSPKKFESLIKVREKMTPGILGWMFCRTRYIDDVIKDYCFKKGIKTIVNLGSGLDCQAYRIPGIEKTRYFEVDHPSMLKLKQKKLKKILGNFPAHVTYVPIDFNTQQLSAELKNGGYDIKTKTLFIWEGVTQYITFEAIKNTFNYISESGSESIIIFTYIRKNFISGEDIPAGIEKFYKGTCTKKNPLWIHGFDPSELSHFLQKFSFSLIEDAGSDEVMDRYMKPIQLDLKVSDIERLALAQKK